MPNKYARKATPKYGHRKTISPIYGLSQNQKFSVDKVVDKLSDFFPQGKLVPLKGPCRTSRLTRGSSSHIWGLFTLFSFYPHFPQYLLLLRFLFYI
jgi:hypothetical protein